jgi:putative SOS response-associated peptidase YedK
VEKGVVDKQPMCIGMKDEEPFLFAGLFSIWKDKEEKEFPSFTIITTSPNELMAEIHDRMPVILPEKNINEWLDPDNKDTVALKKLLVSYPTKEMKAYPVSKFVNSPKNDSPECIKPLKAA